MKCMYPLTLTKADGSCYTVPCGGCRCCRVNRTSQWAIRLMHERRLHENAIFLTLTYADKFLPFPPSVSKRALQLFFKRLRKNIGRSRSMRYYACGEYGSRRGRPHYHAICFGLSDLDAKLIKDAWSMPLLDRKGGRIYLKNEKGGRDLITEYIGRIHIGTVTTQSSRYVAGYCQKQLFKRREEYEDSEMEREFLLCSRRPGIGRDFATFYLQNWLDIGYIPDQGKKKPIPRYYLSQLTETDRRRASKSNYWRSMFEIAERCKRTGEDFTTVLREAELNSDVIELDFEKRDEMFDKKIF